MTGNPEVIPDDAAEFVTLNVLGTANRFGQGFRRYADLSVPIQVRAPRILSISPDPEGTSPTCDLSSK